ncbi:MAG TPA: hypothetical protein VFG83_17495 [Kofleriaceae bacterium]|nr:hypothetical protein [Kofleriaceae bacterium]
MRIFIRAVISGFGFSLGAALYKRASKKLGLDDAKPEATAQGDRTQTEDATIEPDPDDDPAA